MKINYLLVFLIVGILICCAQKVSYAQEEQPGVPKMMSLEELLNVKVEAASKKIEDVFEAPSSASVITDIDINRSGATCIQEALRLLPGVIVREQTNGSFDVEIRGYDCIPPRSSLPYASNLITLVMIDNRVVFRDFQGGTFWEALPIDIHDIKRIEIVRGPSSALYGPNAVAGVINIITKRAEESSFANANFQKGSFNTNLFNASVGYNKDKFNVIASGNYQLRDRYQGTYFDYVMNQYVDDPDSIMNAQTKAKYGFAKTGKTRYPDQDKAMDKLGANTFINYKMSDNVNFDLSLGAQQSWVQKIYVDVLHTPLTTEKSESEYINFKSKIYGLNVQASYLTGYSNTLGVSGWEYDYHTMDLIAEYDLKASDKFSILPGINYRKAVFDDAKGVRNSTYGVGFFNGEYELTTLAGSLRLDYKPTDNLRLIAAVRADKYNYPDDLYMSYQLAATYKINESHLLRIQASKANKGSTMMDIYNSFNFRNFMIYSGNKDIKLTTMNLYEIGYRGKLTDNLHIDLEAFMSDADNFSNASVNDSVRPNSKSPYKVSYYFQTKNFSVKPTQTGATISLNFVPSEKFQIRPYITYQKTKLNDLDYYYDDAVKDSIISVDQEWTPAYFGGLYVNYSPNYKFNANLNLYFFDKQVFYYLYKQTFKGDAQIIVNAKVSYRPINQMMLFVNLRNINLASNKVQFAFADEIKPSLLFGVTFDF